MGCPHRYTFQRNQSVASLGPAHPLPSLAFAAILVVLQACSGSSNASQPLSDAPEANEQLESVEDSTADELPADEASTGLEPPVEPIELYLPSLSQVHYPSPVSFLQADTANPDESPMAYLEGRWQTEFNTNLRRVTTNAVFNVENGRARHFYSKRQAWNADLTYLELADKVVDANSFDVVIDFVPITSERNWSNLNPALMYGVKTEGPTNTFAKYNIFSQVMTQLIQLDGFENCSLGRSEGNISLDDRYAVLICTHIDSGSVQLVAIDIVERSITAVHDAAYNINWASVTPSGNHIVVENNLYPDENPQLLSYDRSFNNERFLSRPNHGDIGIDAEGHEVYVMADEARVRVVRVADGFEYELPITSDERPIGFGHVSCRNVLRPGWCYFSSRNNQWVGAFKISPVETAVEHWSYHRSSYSDYYAEAHATPDRLGRQIVFASDWFNRNEINAYIVETPLD